MTREDLYLIIKAIEATGRLEKAMAVISGPTVDPESVLTDLDGLNTVVKRSFNISDGESLYKMLESNISTEEKVDWVMSAAPSA